MADWDAARYHRLSDPQHAWGLRVLERLAPANGEAILDIGCGTGRLTTEIAGRAPTAHVVGSDLSTTMLSQARAHSGSLAEFVQADATRLPFHDGTFDAVFSTAAFHWVPDHDALFPEIHRVLKRGGRLVSQCGGGPNLERLYRRANQLRQSAPYAEHFERWQGPWNFATPAETTARMTVAGFESLQVSLEPSPISFSDSASYEAFVTTVCLRPYLNHLPDAQRQPFVDTLVAAAAEDDPPLTLDYWRLNADGRRS
jgi:trans-aconitate 2-methyltransferase